MNIVVLGGGTAGWLSALYSQKLFPNANICLIQNSSIGIIGVGEATTPIILDMLTVLDIDIRDVIKKTNASIKNGISFENWNGDGQKFFHSFSDTLIDFRIPNIYNDGCYPFHLQKILNNTDIKTDILVNEIIYNKFMNRMETSLKFKTGESFDNTKQIIPFNFKNLNYIIEDVNIE